MKQKAKRGRPPKNKPSTGPPKKKGRPRKIIPAVNANQLSPEDNKLLSKFVKKAMDLH